MPLAAPRPAAREYSPNELAVPARQGALIELTDLGSVELHDFGAHRWVVEVQYSQGVANLDDGLDADVVVAVQLGVAGKGLKFGASVGEVVAVRVDDRRSECAVVSSRDDEEVDLQRAPLAGVVLVRDTQ